MSEISMHIYHCMFYQFQFGNNASAATRYICTALGESSVADRICQDYFGRFREEDMSLEDGLRSGHPAESNIKRIRVVIEDNTRLTIRELSAMFGCIQSTIDRHLHDIQKVNKLVRWLLHQLTSVNIQQTITMCNFLLSKLNRHRFLQQIVTGDEK